MAFRSSPYENSFREAFGKAYIRLHPYTLAHSGFEDEFFVEKPCTPLLTSSGRAPRLSGTFKG